MTLPNSGVKRLDFLRSIVGLDTAKIQARATELGALPETIAVALNQFRIIQQMLLDYPTSTVKLAR